MVDVTPENRLQAVENLLVRLLRDRWDEPTLRREQKLATERVDWAAIDRRNPAAEVFSHQAHLLWRALEGAEDQPPRPRPPGG